MANSELFESTLDTDRFYTTIRTSNVPRAIQVRRHCEAMWDIYRRYADPQFLDEFPRHFHERWFEMYLTVTLLRRGVQVQTTRPPGPDILVAHGSRRIWIEAICATGGEPGRPDSIAEPRYDVQGESAVIDSGYEQWDKIALRIRNAIQKKRDAYTGYLELGLVTTDDLLVIAVNIAKIPGASLDTQKYVFRSLFGVGNQQIVIDRETREIVGSHNAEQISVRKNNGAEVGTQPFVDGSMSTVAGALVSDFEAMAAADKPDIDLTIFPNLITRSPWTKAALPIDEWVFQDKGTEGWEGSLERFSREQT
jgi:hypothetical protein